MLIPKLNKFQAIPKKKYRVISEDPQTCVKRFPWKPGVKKTSLRELENQHSMVFKNTMRKLWNNLCKLWRTRSFSLVSDTISLPQRYNKKINYHTRVSFFKKKKKILSHLNTVAFTAIKQVSAIWCKLFMMQIIYLDKWKTVAVRIETFISDTAYPIKTSLSPN